MRTAVTCQMETGIGSPCRVQAEAQTRTTGEIGHKLRGLRSKDKQKWRECYKLDLKRSVETTDLD